MAGGACGPQKPPLRGDLCPGGSCLPDQSGFQAMDFRAIPESPGFDWSETLWFTPLPGTKGWHVLEET